MTITRAQSKAPSPHSAPIHMHTQPRIPGEGAGSVLLSVSERKENRGHKTQSNQTL